MTPPYTPLGTVHPLRCRIRPTIPTWLTFASDIAIDQLWFQKVGNNQEVSVLGDQYQVEQFKAGGKTLLDSQVQNLVQAMAAFAPPPAGQTTLPANYQTSLASVLAANWT